MATVRGDIDCTSAANRINAGTLMGLELAADFVLQLANTRVPLEEGTLTRSGRATVDYSALRAAVSYDTVYAVPQHENLHWRHSDGRQAKYLESAINDSTVQVRDIIAAQIRRAAGT